MGFDFLDFGFPKSGTDWKSINGKSEITVSTKGRSNGLSKKINDGADFGVDTTLGATSPSQTGPPYTQTMGAQEAINYIYSTGYTTSNNFPIKLQFLSGHFVLNAPITINPSYPPYYPSLEIYGSGQVSTYLEWSGAASSFNIEFSKLGNITMHDMTVTTDGSNPITSFLNFTNYSTEIQFWSSNVAYQWDNLPINFFNGLVNSSGFMTNFVNCVMVGNVTFVSAGTSPISFFGGLLGQSGNIITINNINGSTFNLFGTQFNGQIEITGAPVWMNIIGAVVNAIPANSPFIVITSASSYAHIINIINSNMTWYVSTSNVSVLEVNNTEQNAINITGGLYYAQGVSVMLTSGTGNLYPGSKYEGAQGISGLGSLTIPVQTYLFSSGTLENNTNPYAIRIKIPVTYNPTSTAAATLATGISPSSTVTTSTKVSIPAGLTAADGQILTYEIVVPAGWYYEFVTTNATMGTGEIQPA